jgi:hypothetical protein
VVSAFTAAAAREVLAFWRRRDSFWLLLGFSLASAMPFFVLVQSLALDPRALAPYPTGGEPVLAGPVPGLSEVLFNFLGFGEVLALGILASFLASRSVEQETTGGSWTLLRLSPTPVAAALAGKATGIAVVLAAVHGLAWSLLLLVVPFLRRSHAELGVAVLGGYLVAASLMPDGFAQVSLLRGARHRASLLRLVTLARLAVLAWLLLRLVPPSPESSERGGFAPFDIWLASLSGGPGAPGALPDPFTPWAIAVAWMGFSGALVARFVVRAWRT